MAVVVDLGSIGFRAGVGFGNLVFGLRLRVLGQESGFEKGLSGLLVF